MSLLCDREWKFNYTPDVGALVAVCYFPALECASRYGRLAPPNQAEAPQELLHSQGDQPSNIGP